jgi:hypothetical protein
LCHRWQTLLIPVVLERSVFHQRCRGTLAAVMAHPRLQFIVHLLSLQSLRLQSEKHEAANFRPK